MTESYDIDLESLNLEQIPSTTWTLLAAGARIVGDPFHTPVIATMSDNGPAQRSVVLRYTDTDTRTIACHTDRRSAKFQEISRNNRLSWLFYDNSRKLQLRLEGNARLLTEGEFFEHCWANITASGRACYNTPLVPGTEVSEPPQAPAKLQTEIETEQAISRFAVILCEINFLDWLYLSAKGHRRARICWQNDQLDARWISP